MRRTYIWEDTREDSREGQTGPLGSLPLPVKSAALAAPRYRRTAVAAAAFRCSSTCLLGMGCFFGSGGNPLSRDMLSMAAAEEKKPQTRFDNTESEGRRSSTPSEPPPRTEMPVEEERRRRGDASEVSHWLEKLSIDEATETRLKREGSKETETRRESDASRSLADGNARCSREDSSSWKGDRKVLASEQEGTVEGVLAKKTDAVILVPRGPVGSRESVRVNPYSPPGASLSSSSDSSQGSPYGFNETRWYGGSLLSEAKVSVVLQQEQFPSRRVVNNKQRYFHHNGGNFQLCSPSDVADVETDRRDRFAVRGPPSAVADRVASPASVASILSAESPERASPGYWTNSPDESGIGSELRSSDTDCSRASSDDSLPEDLVAFINDGSGDSIDEYRYQERIADIIKVIDRVDEVGIDPTSPPAGLPRRTSGADVVRDGSSRSHFYIVGSPVRAAGDAAPDEDRIVSQKAARNGVMSQNHLQLVDAVACQSESDYVVTNIVYVSNPVTNSQTNADGSSSRLFRRIAPKPSAEKERKESKQDAELGRRSRNERALLVDDEAAKLRSALLENFTEEEKRSTTCYLTQRSDERVTQVDNDGDTCLHVAIANHHLLISVLLIDRFAQVGCLDMCNRTGQTPLFNAMLSGQVELFRYLLAKGADPNANIHGGRTLLHYVAEMGDACLEFLKSLCSHPGIDLDAYNHAGQTPLLVAVSSHNNCVLSTKPGATRVVNSIPVVRTLLGSNAATDCIDRLNGKTIYHLAVEKRDVELVKLICAENPNTCQEIDAPAFDHNTPLHVAAALNHCQAQLDIVRVLVSFDASLKKENLARKKPYDMVEKNNKELKKLLKTN